MNSSTSISDADIGALDTYRPIGVIINGSDMVGKITLMGNTETQHNLTEVFSFISKSSWAIGTGRATRGSVTGIRDNTKRCKVDEFKGTLVQYF